LFAVFFVAAGFGVASNGLLRTRWGVLLNLAANMRMVWRWLLLNQSNYPINMPPFGEVPAWTGLVGLFAVCGVALFLLSWKIRAAQEVR
jgi:hypothetical protein